MLYIVATPIGNLEDITIRAINVLKNVDIILAEDTRISRRLLERYNISPSGGVISYHQHSSLKKVDQIIDALEKGKKIALVSDAGTPGINDPGGKLVSQILSVLPEERIIPIPGTNAAVTALSASGFPADSFVYLGFPPHKKGRQTFFKRINEIEDTVVFYESKYRILKTLSELQDIARIEERPMMIARELTKQFETIYRGTTRDIQDKLKDKEPLGEFVVILGPKRYS